MTKTAQILEHVKANPGSTAREIAEALGYDKPIAGLLNQMKWLGYVSRVDAKPFKWYSIYASPKVEPVITPSPQFFKSRGFPGVDIDAVHAKR